jgi:hypothetical protein
MSLCLPLWMGHRSFPAVPALAWLPELTNWASGSLALVFVCSVFLVVVLPRRNWPLLVALSAASLLVLFDINRLQPWLYQYLLLLAALSWSSKPVSVLVFILAATYFWSGVQKLNPSFAHSVFPMLTQKMFKGLPEGFWVLAPLTEISAGVALLWPKSRSSACSAVALIHFVILSALQPGGANLNPVVWPWNICLPLIVCTACWKNKEMVWPEVWREGAGKAAMLLVGVLPALSLLGAWDTYLSFGLYSGKPAEGFIFLSEAAAQRLPQNVEKYVQTSHGRKALDLVRWAMADLGAPPYPEPRVYRGVEAALERRGVPADGMRLIIVKP